MESQQNSNMEKIKQWRQEDLPEKRTPPYLGKWVLDSNGEKMIYVVANDPPIPTHVIPLPPPPSDCGSAFQSDSSLTASHYTFDPNYRSLTFDDGSAHSQLLGSDNEEDEADTIQDKEEEYSVPLDEARHDYNATLEEAQHNYNVRLDGSDRKSNESTGVETADLSDDLEGQGYPQSTFRQGNISRNNYNDQPKKRVTLVEPTKSWKEEKVELVRIQKEIRKTKKREVRCRKAVYVLFFLSFLAIVIGGGLSAMVYYDVIDLDNIFRGKSNSNSTITDLPDSDESNELEDALYENPTMNPTHSPSMPGPTPSPTISTEWTIITDILTGQFRINLPQDDPSAPPNRAVDWMVKELKSVGKGHFDYQYDNLAKFGQRFALLATQYSLLGEDIEMERFSFDEQMGIDECEWEGVDCDDYGRMIGLDYSDLDLTGKIPSEIRYLFKLETLDLSSNGITGSIPKEVYNLRNLNKLYLYQNELTGIISTLIGELSSLEYLHLSQNSLRGSIPEELRSYSYSVLNPLIYLNLYDNKLTGTIPNNLNLGNLLYFDIGRNYIGGSIPADIGTDYGDLKFLHIDHNRLSSSIPDTIPLMANGRMISLLASHNQLSGAVPDNWIMFNKLVAYTLQGNYFDYLGPENCNMDVFAGGQCVEFKADCDICSCDNIFCDAMCSTNN